MGQFLASRRDEFYVATKCGCHMQFAGDHDETPHIWTRENIMRNISDSLMKMRTDYVDILQLHNPRCRNRRAKRPGRPAPGTQAIRRGGSISAVRRPRRTWRPISTGTCSTCSRFRTRRWNGGTRTSSPKPGTRARGSSFAAALPGANRAAAWAIRIGGRAFEKANLDDLLEPGESRTAFLLRFTLSHPHCHTTIVGTMNPAHLAENVAVAQQGARCPPMSTPRPSSASTRLANARNNPRHHQPGRLTGRPSKFSNSKIMIDDKSESILAMARSVGTTHQSIWHMRKTKKYTNTLRHQDRSACVHLQ